MKPTIHERSSSNQVFTLISIFIIGILYHSIMSENKTPSQELFILISLFVIFMVLVVILMYAAKAHLRVQKMNSKEFKNNLKNKIQIINELDNIETINLIEYVTKIFDEEFIYIKIEEVRTNFNSAANMILISSIDYQPYWITLDPFQISIKVIKNKIYVTWVASPNFFN